MCATRWAPAASRWRRRISPGPPAPSPRWPTATPRAGLCPRWRAVTTLKHWARRRWRTCGLSPRVRGGACGSIGRPFRWTGRRLDRLQIHWRDHARPSRRAGALAQGQAVGQRIPRLLGQLRDHGPAARPDAAGAPLRLRRAVRPADRVHAPARHRERPGGGTGPRLRAGGPSGRGALAATQLAVVDPAVAQALGLLRAVLVVVLRSS